MKEGRVEGRLVLRKGGRADRKDGNKVGRKEITRVYIIYIYIYIYININTHTHIY
jgi:hypothetical protein